MPIAHALPSWLIETAPRRSDRAPSLPARRIGDLRDEAPAASRPFGSAEVHGLRNPLAGVRATVQLAQLQSEPGSEVTALLGEALAEVDRLDERIRALLTLHTPQQLKPRSFDLADLFERVARALESRCEAQHLVLGWQIGADLRCMRADPELLEEALLELCQNALRASPGGGRLLLDARLAGERVEIRVRDTGSGIPEAIRSRIFDPFFTTRRDGSGIGLANLRHRLEACGGALLLESSSEAGSCFLLRLPRRSAEGPA